MRFFGSRRTSYVEKELTTLVTNNDRVYEKYRDVCRVELLDGYEAVLIRVRDLVYDRHILLTHPRPPA